MEEKVILVDEKDKQIGVEEKIKAHQNGAKLHRAFSIFIFNDKGEMLLQKRADSKYHAGGLWTNTCCSHPRPKEILEEATQRRLKEEFGFTVPMEEIFHIIYRANVGNGLTEWEFDHIFFGLYDNEEINPNPEEIGDWKWMSVEDVVSDIENNPNDYTPWFKIILRKVLEMKDRIPENYSKFF